MKRYLFILFLIVNVFVESNAVYPDTSDNEESKYETAIGLIDNKEYDKAKNIFYQILSDNNKFSKAYFGLGVLSCINKDYKKAELFFKKALYLSPNSYKTYYNLGEAYASLHDYDRALLCYRKSIVINPDFYNGHYRIGRVFYDKSIELGNSEHWKKEKYLRLSLKYLLEALKIEPRLIQAHYIAGSIYYSLYLYFNDPEAINEAKNKFIAVLKLNDKYSDTHYKLGWVYWEKKDWDNCISEWQKEIKINPHNEQVINWLLKAKANGNRRDVGK